MWVLQPRFARPRFVRRALSTVTPRTGGATIVGTARTPEVPTPGQRLHHLTRHFGGLFILRAERFRVDLHADVVFGTARLGGESDSPVRFVVPDTYMGRTIRLADVGYIGEDDEREVLVSPNRVRKVYIAADSGT